ncbi:hypothetical protein OnM2_001032 [Erysiphe neolycopersici]|uniref:DRBM domain-containing protein n=1 Tax=Erysiphe neolycopersici TaxID=212602 RepID=A0A420I8H1_9PEZI|nr:hypothetical protein OnM2_001032 [Erysiphe neolycopersici]
MISRLETLLQELCTRRGWDPPVYALRANASRTLYDCTVTVNNQKFQGERVRTEARAKEVAARNAHQQLTINSFW